MDRYQPTYQLTYLYTPGHTCTYLYLPVPYLQSSQESPRSAGLSPLLLGQGAGAVAPGRLESSSRHCPALPYHVPTQGLLTTRLPRPYLAAWLDILQTLRAKVGPTPSPTVPPTPPQVPSLVDRLLSAPAGGFQLDSRARAVSR